MDDTQAPSLCIRSAAVNALCELAALPQSGFPKNLRAQVNGVLHEMSAVAGPHDSGNFRATLDELSDDQARSALDQITACYLAIAEWQAGPYT